MPQIEVDSQHVQYKDDVIISDYKYQTSSVICHDNKITVRPREICVTFCTERRVPRLGCMLVGWGGNNGATITAAVLANKLDLQWHTKHGLQSPNYYGSITQSSTVWLGGNGTKDVFVPMRDLLPLVDPNDIVFDGWDISSLNLADAMERARVLDYELQTQLREHMEKLVPRKSPYYKDFIAANQSDRADNVLEGSKKDHLEQIRSDIRDFKQKEQLDKVIVLWTANTERFCDVRDGLNDTADNLLQSIDNNEDEVSQSTVFAVASILEGCCYINGSPQNTFVPGVIDLAEKKKVFIGGDDLKTGQTKLKSVIIDFLVSAGIKPLSIVSYNHLGNNDGMNLSAPEQFRSKEVTKRTVVDDMVDANKILYPNDEKPDHCIVIKYVPFVGDSKRALDEYSSELMLGGRNTIVIHDTCEDSLLATPVILDLIILAELCQRISFEVKEGGEGKGKDKDTKAVDSDKERGSKSLESNKDKDTKALDSDKDKDTKALESNKEKGSKSLESNKDKDTKALESDKDKDTKAVDSDKDESKSECCKTDDEFQHFHSVLSILSYLCKAPLVPPCTPVVNALFRQRACIDNIMRACVGLAPINNMMLEHKIPDMISQHKSQCNNDECKP